MKYILARHGFDRSAKLLASKLSELVGEQIFVKTQLDRDMTHRNGVGPLLNKCIIRYGNSRYGDTIGNTDFNLVAVIAVAGNKLALSNNLKRQNFPHVEIFSPSDSINPQNDRFPVAIRKELNGSGGSGIIVCENWEEYLQNIEYHWSYWYDFTFELGVHILGGKVAKVFKKVRTEGLEEEKYPIRNTQRGYSFSLKENWKELYGGLEKFVTKLYETVPVEFGRLDVGYDKKTGGYRLIEINTAPDLSQNQNTLNMYANFLKERIFS